MLEIPAILFANRTGSNARYEHGQGSNFSRRKAVEESGWPRQNASFQEPQRGSAKSGRRKARTARQIASRSGMCEAFGPGRARAGGNWIGQRREGMADILRGDIRWADLAPTRGSEQAGRRPVVVLSEDVFNRASGTVIAMALTSQKPRADFPLTLELTGSRLPKRSWVKISQIRTLSVQRIGTRIGRASTDDLSQLLDGLNEILGN